MRLPNSLRRAARTEIRNERDLFFYVVRTSLFCLALALAVDVTNQLVFFAGWAAALRSWAVTVGVVLVIAVPVSRSIGKAHLDLFRAKAEAVRLSRTDPLTGLLNRRAVLEVAETPRPELMVLVIADIDRFKNVNDRDGHLVGDRAIRAVAETMAEELGQFGLVGRIGGDEFALIAWGIDAASLVGRLEAFAARIANMTVPARGRNVALTVSVGAALGAPNQSFAELYSDADRALYAAKQGGRNRVKLSPALAASIASQRTAIAAGAPGDRDEADWRTDTDVIPPATAA